MSALQNCCIISTVQSSLHLEAVREERSGNLSKANEEDNLMLFVQFAASLTVILKLPRHADHHG